MKRFKEFLREDFLSKYTPAKLGSSDSDWSHGLAKQGNTAHGNSVTIHKPGHEWHGKSGRIIRQQGTQFAIEIPEKLGKVDYFNHGELKRGN